MSKRKSAGSARAAVAARPPKPEQPDPLIYIGGVLDALKAEGWVEASRSEFREGEDVNFHLLRRAEAVAGEHETEHVVIVGWRQFFAEAFVPAGGGTFGNVQAVFRWVKRRKRVPLTPGCCGKARP